MAERMDRHTHNAHQAITNDVLNRMSTMTDQRSFDTILARILYKQGGTAFLDDESGFFPGTGANGNLMVTQGSGGNRQTGYGMKIQVGLGFKRMSVADQNDPDKPNFVPMFGAVEKTFTTANSDPTNPRMDHVYMKPKETPGNPTSVNVISPTSPFNISSSSLNINTAYDYDFAYAVGTPDAGAAGGAGAPPPPSGYTANDKISEIIVLAGSGTTIDLAQITSTREIFAVDPLLLGPGVSSLAASAITVTPTVEGQADAQLALEALETQVALMRATGQNVGEFRYVNTSTVEIAPGLGGVVKIDVDGTTLSQGTALQFDLATDLDTGSEANSTPYYCYAFDVASALTAKISATAPDDVGDTKPGYHPSNPTWRCVGMFYNDASGNIANFVNSRGRTQFAGSHAGGITHDLPVTQATWLAEAMPEVPLTAPFFFGLHMMKGASATGPIALLGPDGVTGDPGAGPLLDDFVDWVSCLVNETGSSDLVAHSNMVDMPVTDRGVPAMSVAVQATLTEHQFNLKGWVDPWSPIVSGW